MTQATTITVKSWTMEEPTPEECAGEEFTVQVVAAGFHIGLARVRIVKGVDGNLTHQIIGGVE
jgi:hypothetical protein